MYALTLLSTALFAGAAFGQTHITAPAAGSTVTAGSEITVQVTVVGSLLNFDEISVAIGLQSCPDGSCNPTDQYLGTILYQGSYSPQASGVGNNLFENFTVTIPASTASGQATLGVANFYLAGGGFGPYLDVVSETLNIASA
ncbi:hypothetical protein HYDPIDRAFT_118773 [Hydnomerulius pinastri MD-312]|uniref:Uncharacterized protein n=1 Tax=Hydnomerulius pinastri MD-312 TaxID=994086 RepID=A0A0C9W893_9AGAM|nr:hypothetical protein HYDPIDRAFT_118773 [Hydnomerulius pinastri MD-312]